MLSDLLDHNVLWATEKLREDPEYFKRLSALQRPEFLWIGCSDSRVPANEIVGLDAGDYIVEFKLPLGYLAFTLADVPGDDALDSDAQPATGKTGVIAIGIAEDNDTVDAGLIAVTPPAASS